MAEKEQDSEPAELDLGLVESFTIRAENPDNEAGQQARGCQWDGAMRPIGFTICLPAKGGRRVFQCVGDDKWVNTGRPC